jgi:hypothetical protein
MNISTNKYPDSFFPDDVCVTLKWPPDVPDVQGVEVTFWLTPKERKQLRKALK